MTLLGEQREMPRFAARHFMLNCHAQPALRLCALLLQLVIDFMCLFNLHMPGFVCFCLLSPHTSLTMAACSLLQKHSHACPSAPVPCRPLS
jgi:hypothetical protein